MKEKTFLIPLPSYGFDPSEAAFPCKLMTDIGFEIVLIAPDGKKADADKIMLDGKKTGNMETAPPSPERCNCRIYGNGKKPGILSPIKIQ